MKNTRHSIILAAVITLLGAILIMTFLGDGVVGKLFIAFVLLIMMVKGGLKLVIWMFK